MQNLQKISVELLGENNAQQAYLGRPNTLRLLVTNYTGGPLPLAGGPATGLPTAGGSFALVLSLGQLYASPDAQAALQLTLPAGWRAEFVRDGDDDEFPAWVLRPGASQPWPNQAALTFTIAGLTPTVPPGLYFADVELHNLAGVTRRAYRPVMGVAAAPAAGLPSVTQALGAALRSATVFVTKRADEPYVNELEFSVFNRLDTALAPGDAQPELTLFFVPAATPLGYHALASAEAIALLDVDCLSGDWLPDKQPGTVVKWRCKPSARRAAVLGTGEQGVSRFVVRNVVTTCWPGATVMYLHVTGVPGYADGFLSQLLTKEYAPLEIREFQASQREFTLFDAPPFTTRLSWDVRHATHVLLSEGGLVPSRRTDHAVSLTTDQTYELTALDTATGQVQTQTLKVRVTPPLAQRRPAPGSLALWSGVASDIPLGWYLCDGRNQTPDLRDYFVLGAGGSAQPGEWGRPTHAHTVARPLRTVAEKAGLHEHEANWDGGNRRQAASQEQDETGLPVAAEADPAAEAAAARPATPAAGSPAPEAAAPDEAQLRALPRQSYYPNSGYLTVSGGDHYHPRPDNFAELSTLHNHALDAEHEHKIDVVCRPTVQPAQAPRPAWLALCYICYRG